MIELKTKNPGDTIENLLETIAIGSIPENFNYEDLEGLEAVLQLLKASLESKNE